MERPAPLRPEGPSLPLVDPARASSASAGRGQPLSAASLLAFRLLFALSISCADPALLAAEEDPEKASQNDPSKSAETDHDWAPLTPNASKYDWIQLDSGEWLKGKIKLIQNDTISFDSAKLDDLDFDWDDISELLTGPEHTFRFLGRRIVTGTGRMKGDTIRIRSGDAVKEFKKSDLVNMVPGSGKELDYWSLDVSVGLSGQAGNTDQLSLNTSVSVARATAITNTSLDYTGNIATQSSDLSANNHRAVAAFKYYLSRRLYLVVPTLEAFQDEFQNIELRITPAAGLGYIALYGKRVKWQAGFSAGYQGTKFFSVSEGDDSSNDIAIQLNTDFDIDLPKRFEWDTSYQLQLIATDIGKTNQHLSSTFSFDLWGPVDLDTTFQWDWVNQPTANAAGNVPEQSDFRISVGFGLDL